MLIRDQSHLHYKMFEITLEVFWVVLGKVIPYHDDVFLSMIGHYVDLKILTMDRKCGAREEDCHKYG